MFSGVIATRTLARVRIGDRVTRPRDNRLGRSGRSLGNEPASNHQPQISQGHHTAQYPTSWCYPSDHDPVFCRGVRWRSPRRHGAVPHLKCRSIAYVGPPARFRRKLEGDIGGKQQSAGSRDAVPVDLARSVTNTSPHPGGRQWDAPLAGTARDVERVHDVHLTPVG